MGRIGTIAVIFANAALAVANVAVFLHARGHTQRIAATPHTAWERWQACSPAERQTYVEQYQGIDRREDAASVFRQAREFAQLPPVEQDRLRRLQRLLAETIDRQTASGRHELLRMAPRGRAFLVYQVLAADDPDTLARLRAEWDTPP